MHIKVIAALVAAASLAACGQQAPSPAGAPPAADIATFDDGGCIGVLLLQRNAVIEGRAQGDQAELDAAIAAWRASAEGVLTATELQQYEASSFAVEDGATPEALAQSAGVCIATAPQT